MIVRRALWVLGLSLSSLCCKQQPTPEPALEACLQRTITGHSAVVWDVAFSPDGSLLASCSPDRTVRLWRWREGMLAGALTHPAGVTSIAFSPDGRWLASGSYDQAVRIWRLRDGALARTLAGRTGAGWPAAARIRR